MSYAFESQILDVPDFPKPGITFKDITPVLADPSAFAEVIEAFRVRWQEAEISAVVGVESRGFIFGAALAQALGVGLVLVRKPGKLPRHTYAVSYELEYGSDRLEIHADAFGADGRALIVDDVLATGGTASACVELVRRAGAKVVGCTFLLELDFLAGRKRLPMDVDVHSLVHVG